MSWYRDTFTLLYFTLLTLLCYENQPIDAVCGENHTKQACTFYGKNAEFKYDWVGGTCNNHWALKG
jgi:hypothetical protein